MAENFDVFDFQLTDEEMTDIAAMDTGASVFFDHRDPGIVSRIGNVRGNLSSSRDGRPVRALVVTQGATDGASPAGTHRRLGQQAARMHQPVAPAGGEDPDPKE
jgi:hypothetical protein